MALYQETEDYKLFSGKMEDVLQTFENNSIDCIITEPPYELNFMGKSWDKSSVSFSKETWNHCFKVLKSGGYLIAFGGSRTYHRIACAIEDAGFEIRDCMMWLYGSGFPKSMNLGLAIDKKMGIESKVIGEKKTHNFKEHNGSMMSRFNIVNEKTTTKLIKYKKASNNWQGWGTCLKPAYEPIIIARKPFKGSLINNVLINGVGGINIDECRIGSEERTYKGMSKKQPENAGCFRDDNWIPKDIEVTANGRFPSNVVLTYDESDFEEVCENMSNSSRYFYCAKASKKDRDEGLEAFEERNIDDGSVRTNQETERKFGANPVLKRNIHPTVKPVDLMQYLVRMFAPKGSIILDPFMGSGSTGKAVMYENRERNSGYKFIGIELTKEYLPICKARIEYAKKKDEYTNNETKQVSEQRITTIFDFLTEEKG